MMRIFLYLFGTINYLAALVFMAIGYDKYANYDNYEDGLLSDMSVNAYVGGDAYNFIINGTYMTAFFALAVAFYLAGTLFFLAGVFTARQSRTAHN